MYYQMDGKVTIDEKPICVILEEAQSRTRAPPSTNAPQNAPPSTLFPPAPYGYPPAAPPVIVLPSWGMPGTMPQNYGMVTGDSNPSPLLHSNQLPDVQC